MNTVGVEDTPAEVPDAFPEVWRSEVATEIVGGRATSKGVTLVAVDCAPLSATIPVSSNLG